MKVYHGSTAVVENPLVGAGRNNLDFGCGFYVTDLEEQAISWASRPLNSGKLPDEKVPELLETVKKLDNRNREVGVKAFVWNIEQMI